MMKRFVALFLILFFTLVGFGQDFLPDKPAGYYPTKPVAGLSVYYTNHTGNTVPVNHEDTLYFKGTTGLGTTQGITNITQPVLRPQGGVAYFELYKYGEGRIKRQYIQDGEIVEQPEYEPNNWQGNYYALILNKESVGRYVNFYIRTTKPLNLSEFHKKTPEQQDVSRLTNIERQLKTLLKLSGVEDSTEKTKYEVITDELNNLSVEELVAKYYKSKSAPVGNYSLGTCDFANWASQQGAGTFVCSMLSEHSIFTVAKELANNN